MKSQLIFTLIISSLLWQTNASFKILGLFPHPGNSHFAIFQPLMKELAVLGHDVTVISHFPEKNPVTNYKDLPLTGLESLTNAVSLDWFTNRPKYGHFLEFFMLYDWGMNACKVALNSTAIDTVLNSKIQYDLVILEQFNSDCMVGVAHKLNAPFIGLSSCALMPWHYERVGNPHIPSYIPGLFMGYSDKMTFSQRVANWVTIQTFKVMYNYFSNGGSNELLRAKFGPDMQDIQELTKKTSLMLVNQHYSLSGVKPITPAVIEIGGIHIKDPAPLDPEIQELLDTADHGVIYISWGSMIRADTLPIVKREALLNALSKFPQRVVWKWENDTLPNQPSNVFIKKWLPQRDILCHPKVRLFISHGGLLGASEAAHCGVPLVVTPMYGDQFLNAAALVDRGMAVILPFEDITRENVFRAIKQALEPSKMESAKRVSHTYRNRQQSPLNTAVWWAEYVAATRGAPLLHSHATDISFIEYYSLDVLALIFSIITLNVFSWLWIVKRIFGSKKSSDKMKKQ